MKPLKRFIQQNNGWAFLFEDGTTEFHPALTSDISALGKGEFFENSGYLSCSWDFDEYKLCPICKNGKWGFVNKKFEYTIPCKYDFAGIAVKDQVYIHCCNHTIYFHHYFWDAYTLSEQESEKYLDFHERVKPFYCPVLLGNRWLQIDENGNELAFDNINTYKTALNRIRNVNISSIIKLCHELLPEQWKSYPWKHPELVHGIGLLASEEALNCYMSAYGEMHVGKLRAAIMNFPFNKLVGSIEIVDWGCGQGIGSTTLIEVLQQRDLLKWVKRITLVEPSPNAIQRALCNISKMVDNNIEINAINKFMPATVEVTGEVVTSIGYRYSKVIHVFSNILDVKAIDLAKVARMVASSHGNHFILCMGPKNSAAYRIEQFCSVFGEQEYFLAILIA